MFFSPSVYCKICDIGKAMLDGFLNGFGQLEDMRRKDKERAELIRQKRFMCLADSENTNSD